MTKPGRPPEGKYGMRKRDYPQLNVRIEPMLLGHVPRSGRAASEKFRLFTFTSV